MEEKINYSIIIPHYNIPKLLKRCLFSIPRRNDLQIIVVDDKSSEDVIYELKKIESEFSNVDFVYSDTNGGGGRARNIGLNYAKGKYVLFADADDFFNYCIHDILEEYLNEDCDIVFFNANHIDTDTYLNAKIRSSLIKTIKQYNKEGNMDSFRFIFGEPWCKLVKRDLLKTYNIRFDELPVHNDTKFSYLVGYHAKEIKFDNRALYCRTDRAGSVSKNVKDEKFAIRTRVYAEKNQFLKDHNISYYDNLMTTPFWHYAKKGDWIHYKSCLSIIREYGFTHRFILCKLMSFFVFIVYNKIKRYCHLN